MKQRLSVIGIAFTAVLTHTSCNNAPSGPVGGSSHDTQNVVAPRSGPVGGSSHDTMSKKPVKIDTKDIRVKVKPRDIKKVN